MINDTIYDDLDELSKLVEPILHTKSEQIQVLPQEILFSQEDTANYICDHIMDNMWGSGREHNIYLEVGDIMCYWWCAKNNISTPFDHIHTAHDFYDVSIIYDDKPSIDLQNRKVNFCVRLIKKKYCLSDEQMKKDIKESVTRNITRVKSRKSAMITLARLLDVTTVAGGEKFASLDKRDMRIKLADIIYKAVDDNTLNIKTIEAAVQLNTYIIGYIVHEKDDCLAAIIKAKLVSKIKPIYTFGA